MNYMIWLENAGAGIQITLFYPLNCVVQSANEE